MTKNQFTKIQVPTKTFGPSFSRAISSINNFMKVKAIITGPPTQSLDGCRLQMVSPHLRFFPHHLCTASTGAAHPPSLGRRCEATEGHHETTCLPFLFFSSINSRGSDAAMQHAKGTPQRLSQSRDTLPLNSGVAWPEASLATAATNSQTKVPMHSNLFEVYLQGGK